MNKSQKTSKIPPRIGHYIIGSAPQETPIIKIKRSQQVSTYVAVVLFYHSYHFNIRHLVLVTSPINCFNEA